MTTDPRFPRCPDWTGTDDPHAYGLRAFSHFEKHGPAQMSDDAIDRALSASITLVTVKDCHPPIREYWQTLRARLRRTSDARQLARARTLAALAEMLAKDAPASDDRPHGGSKVPTHPTPPAPPTPDAQPIPVTRPTPALPFTL